MKDVLQWKVDTTEDRIVKPTEVCKFLRNGSTVVYTNFRSIMEKNVMSNGKVIVRTTTLVNGYETDYLTV